MGLFSISITSWSDDDSVIGSKYNHLNLRRIYHSISWDFKMFFSIWNMFLPDCRLVSSITLLPRREFIKDLQIASFLILVEPVFAVSGGSLFVPT